MLDRAWWPRSEQAHQAILRATLELLGEALLRPHGRGRRGAGRVGKATIYRRWPSKLPLVVEAFHELPQLQDAQHRRPDRRGPCQMLRKPCSCSTRPLLVVAPSLAGERRHNPELRAARPGCCATAGARWCGGARARAEARRARRRSRRRPGCRPDRRSDRALVSFTGRRIQPKLVDPHGRARRSRASAAAELSPRRPLTPRAAPPSLRTGTPARSAPGDRPAAGRQQRQQPQREARPPGAREDELRRSALQAWMRLISGRRSASIARAASSSAGAAPARSTGSSRLAATIASRSARFSAPGAHR